MKGRDLVAAEKNFENKVKEILKSKGAYFVKQFGCAFSKSGVPDLLVCYKGRFIAVELKAEKGEPSALQLYNLDEIRKAGGYGFLLYPKDLPIFLNFLTGLENE